MPKRSGAFFLLTDPQKQIKLSFNEIYITLNRILGKHDNILLAGVLNSDELKTGSGSSNHFSDAKNFFNFTDVVKKPTSYKFFFSINMRLHIKQKIQ